MVILKNHRIESIIANYKECILAISQSYSRVNDTDLVMADIARRAFKADMIDLFKVIEDYLAFTLKSIGVTVNELTIREALDMSLRAGKIDNKFYDQTIKHKIIRDKYSHHYGKPTFKQFLKFYEESREAIEKQLYIIEKENIK